MEYKFALFYEHAPTWHLPCGIWTIVVIFPTMIRSVRALFFVSLVMLGGAAFSQVQTIIQGNLNEFGAEEVKLIYTKVPFASKPLELKAQADSNGGFFIQFPLDKKANIDF